MGTRIAPDVIVQPVSNTGNGEQIVYTYTRQSKDDIVWYITAIRRMIGKARRLNDQKKEVCSTWGELASTLHIQAVAFDKSSKLLFSLATKNRQDVDAIFEDPHHSIWADRTVHWNLARRMARYYNLCLEVLEHCRETLNDLQQGLKSVKIYPARKSIIRWLDRSQFTSSATTNNLAMRVQSSRRSIDLFSTLVWQCVSNQYEYMVRVLPAEELDHPNPIQVARMSHRGFAHIKTASQLLYDTLSSAWTCHKHKTHDVGISLKSDFAKASGATSNKDFSFNITVKTPHSDEILGNSFVELRSQARCSPFCGSRARTIACNAGCKLVSETLSEAPQSNIRDLSLEKNLCLCLRQSCAAINSEEEADCTCLGYLKASSDIFFLFFYVFREERQKQRLSSLDDILASANHEHFVLPVKRRLTLALLIGEGFLYLRTSSWLHGLWSSKDIHFIDVDVSDSSNAFMGAFLQTQLKRSGVRQDPASEEEEADAFRSTLRSLGLILIEIAYSAPWRNLQSSEDIIKGLTEWERNFITLMLLSENVSRELGSRYAKVVRTCLDEGFTKKGVHRRQVELDIVVYHDIVGELRECFSAVSEDLGMSRNWGAPTIC